MLERVAVHQTRLRAPGLGLDAKGIALGAKGLVLLPALDRLVAFLALYTRQGSLGDFVHSLGVEIVRSKLGAREVALTFAADGSDRMDRFAEVARLAGGYTFTGTSRHFVQYRDATAPFGFDLGQVTPSDAPLVLYHSAFFQTYVVERTIDLRGLLLRLEPHVDPEAGREGGVRWICAEAGLGPALIQYFVRSGVSAEVGLAEWPPESTFDDAPVVRYLFRVAAVPARMVPLLTKTPGLSVFVPVAPGAAVEVGFRHPVSLRACPIFDGAGLVLFRGHHDPLEVSRVPAMGDVAGFARMEFRGSVQSGRPSSREASPAAVSIPLRVVPSLGRRTAVAASWVRPEELPLLRQLAYALGPSTLRGTQVALTQTGAFLRNPEGVEGIPVGELFREVRSDLFLSAGFDALPAVAPEVLYRALGAPVGQVIFIGRDGLVVGVPTHAFVPLETALLEAQTWTPLGFLSVESALATELPEVILSGPGVLPLRDVPSAGALAKALPEPE